MGGGNLERGLAICGVRKGLRGDEGAEERRTRRGAGSWQTRGDVGVAAEGSWEEQGRGSSRRGGQGRAVYELRRKREEGRATGEGMFSSGNTPALDGRGERPRGCTPPVCQCMRVRLPVLPDGWRRSLLRRGPSSARASCAIGSSSFALHLWDSPPPRGVCTSLSTRPPRWPVRT